MDEKEGWAREKFEGRGDGNRRGESWRGMGADTKLLCAPLQVLMTVLKGWVCTGLCIYLGGQLHLINWAKGYCSRVFFYVAI